MSVRQLVDRIEQMGLVDDRVLQKIRREIDDPEKNVKPKGILNFLVKKEQITKAQAAKLLKEVEAPVPVDEIEVNVQVENDYDSADLTNLNPQEEEVVSVEEVEAVQEIVAVEEVEIDYAKTQVDMGGQLEPDNLQSQVFTPEEVITPTQTVQPVVQPQQMPAYQDQLLNPMPMNDPLATGLGASPGELPGTGNEKEASKSLRGFAGKREQSDQWATKWLYIGFGILGFLMIMLAVLYIAVGGQNLEALQQEAEQSFETGAYQNAIAQFEKLLETSPRHEKAGKWKVRIVHSMLRDPYERGNHSEVLKVADSQLPDVTELEEFDELSDDLGQVLLPTSAFIVTNGAVKAAEKTSSVDELTAQLEIAKNAKGVVDNDSYIRGSQRKLDSVARQLDEIKDNVRRLEDAIKKEGDYDTAKNEITQLTEQGQTDNAFNTFNRLVRRYGDLGARQELRDLMKAVSVKERELVGSAGVQLLGQKEEPDSLIESAVVVARREGAGLSSLKGEVVPVVDKGVIYGVDAGDGMVRWNRYLGYQTDHNPQWSDKENRDELIITNQTTNSVLKIKAMDGSLVWRTDIGESFAEPLVTPGKVFVTTESGKVIGLNAMTGDTFASVQLPQSLSIKAAATEVYPYIYQVGDYSNLYVLDINDLSCQEVVYLGHSRGSLTVPPIYWSGYFLLPVNDADYCDLQVLRPIKQDDTPAGLGLIRTQIVSRVTDGHISQPLFRLGRRYLAVSDTGNLKLLEMNKVDDETAPIVPFAQGKIRVRKGDKSYIQAEGNWLWIAGKGIERFRVSQIGEFKPQPFENADDYFLSPVVKIDNVLIHVRRRAFSAMTSVSAVDYKTMNELWRTDLGAAFAGAPVAGADGINVVSSQGDLFSIDPTVAKIGYTNQGVWSKEKAQDLIFDQAVQLRDGSFVCTAPLDRADFIHVKTDGTSKLGRLQSPADRPSCKILAFGNSILVCSKKGQVVLVDPLNGRRKGNPFQPPKSPQEESNWRTPGIISPTQMIVGLDSGKIYVLDSDESTLTMVSELDLETSLDTGFVVLDGNAYAVIGGENGQELVAWSTNGGIQELAKTPLPAGAVAGPWLAGNQILIANEDGDLVAYNQELGEPAWSVPMNNDKLVGEPIVSDGVSLLSFASGNLILIDESGQIQKQVDIGQPISHQPIFANGKVYVGGEDGRLLVIPDSAF